MDKIEVVGIDPSLRNFGMSRALIDLDTLEIEVTDLKLISPDTIDKTMRKVVRRNSDDLRRARYLHDGMQDYVKGARLAFVEVPVGSQSSRAMASYGICVGVLASCPVPIIEVTPTEVKLTATGSKVASKQQMIDWASSVYPEAPWLTRKPKGKGVPTAANEHLADSVAAIHAGILTEQFGQLMSLLKAA